MKSGLAILIFGLTGFFFFGCESHQSQEYLASRVKQYYADEKNKNWERTYAFRTETFRENITYSQYVREMEKGTLDWELEEVKIRNIIKKGNKAQVFLTFKEKPPTGFFNQFDFLEEKRKKMEFLLTKAWGLWIFENGDWYCLDAASRNHIEINSQQFY
jgi:hypothetical protein